MTRYIKLSEVEDKQLQSLEDDRGTSEKLEAALAALDLLEAKAVLHS